jgi:hypothetical protein
VQPQRADGRTGIRNRSPPVHTVAGEAFDRAGFDGCADDLFVHDPTVSNQPRSPRLVSDRVSAR